ncbi:MAG TPA: NTP transferase domain-containing protein [Acidimicrobiales bacterium]
MGEPRHVAAAVLAAGGSSRFDDGPKQLVSFRGRPLVVLAVEAALAADVFDVVFVVGGAVDLGTVVPPEALLLENPDWADGQATSLTVAVRAAEVGGFDAVVVGLADQPFVGPDDWRTVALADASEPIVAASYEGRRGNPVRLAREVWPDLPTTGDEGARRLMAVRPELVAEVACPGDAVDIDTREDLDRWS